MNGLSSQSSLQQSFALSIGSGHGVAEQLNRAADEIEKLRAENARLRRSMEK
jgi:hypothetical protein